MTEGEEGGPPPERRSARNLLRAWDRWASPRARAAAVLVVALLGAVGYGLFLHLGVPGGAFHGYPIGDWLFWKLGAMWAWGLYLSAACVSAGFWALTRLFRVSDLPTLETVVQSAALGLVVFVLGMFAGGVLRQYHAAFAVLWPSVMLACGARPLLGFARARLAAFRSSARPRAPLSDAVALLAAVYGLFGLIFLYLGVMTPESINFDASWSHLTIAADYARKGRIIPFDGDYTRNFPHLASFVHTWPMIVPSFGIFTQPPIRWMFALHLEFFFFLWTLAGVAAMASWLLGTARARGTWASFALFPAIFVYDCNLGGAADHYLAFFAPPLFLAAVRAALPAEPPAFAPRASALCGVFAAAALFTKYQALYLLFGVAVVYGGIWLAAAARKLRGGRAAAGALPWPTLIRGPLAALAAFALVLAPQLLKNTVYYRNPVYPFAQDVFPSRPTTPGAAYLYEWLFKDYAWRPHGGLVQTLGEAVSVSFGWSFLPHYSFTHYVPDGGALFTLCLPMALFLRSPRRIWLGYAAAMAAFFAWGMIFRVDRHLQTFMPLVWATTAAVLVRAWELGGLARVGLGLLCGLQVIWGGDAAFYSGHERFKAAIDLVRSGYEGRAATRFDGYRATDRAIGAALPQDARVVLHMYRPNLGIDRDLVLDWAGQQALIFYEDLHGPRGLYEHYKDRGITHLLWIPGRRPASTKQEDVLFTDFVHRFARNKRRFGAEELSAMPEGPPPPDAPYRVLSLGLEGYADGLYPVEAMKTYEDIPKNAHTHETFAPPEIPLPREAGAQVALASEASAVCLGEGFRPGPALKSRLDALFESATTYPKAFSILVRRGGPAPR